MRYQQHKHSGGLMANSSEEEYINFLSSSWCKTIFVEFLIDTELAAVAVVDLLDNELSAVYTFFDPKFSNYSLGTYAVLWQLDYAQSKGLEFVYLGFWIKDCQKMAYKMQYKPMQGYTNKEWHVIQN
jgi:arginine-tRNA-protein transferase